MKKQQSRFRTRAGLAALAAGVLVLSGCAAGDTPDAEGPSADQGAFAELEPIELRVALPFPDNTTPSLGIQAWMEEITENTDGKVTFDVYYNSTLFAATEAMTALESGLAEVALYADSWFPEQLPVGNWNDRVIATEASTGFPHTILAGNPVIASLYNTEPALREELAAHNAVPLFQIVNGPFFFLCNSPVETLEQAEGKQIRVGGQPWTDEVTEAGFVPVFIAPAEMYESLQRGVIDCISTDPATANTTGVLEVAKYLSLSAGGTSSGSGFAFAKNVWEDLPESVQEVITDAQGAYVMEFAKTTLEAWADLITNAEAEGITFVDTTEFDTLWTEYRSKLLPEIEASAPAGIDGPAHVQDVRGLIAEWNSWIQDELGIASPSATGNLDSLIAAYSAGSEGIDWDAYDAKVREWLPAASD